jgi:putative nucleotidyltransferase with HDIG domain
VKDLPLRARIFIGGVFFGAAAVVAYAVSADNDFRPEIAFTFGVLILLADQFPVKLSQGDGSVSVAFVLVIAAIILGGPAEAGIAQAFGFITFRNFRRTPIPRHLFNVGELALGATLAGLAYHATGGITFTSPADMFPRVFLPVLAATTIQFLVNSGLVAVVVTLVRGGKLMAVWRAQFRWLATGYMAFAALGIVLAALHIQMGIASIIFLLVPLLVARNAFQASVEMESGYDSTVRSLIKAIEAKDPYTRGHAERVARLSEMTARAYGLSSEQCRVIRYIALMHDVGKLGVSTKILAKPGKLTDEEYEHMKQHPVRGYEIVSEIDFLKAAAETAVRHHHERMDGRGYPDGLVGEQIPVIARIVMVCDAFDSMTSTRVYRKAKGIEDAMVELHRCAGTQFDEVALAALERAIASEGWEAEPEPREEEEVGVGGAVVAL